MAVKDELKLLKAKREVQREINDLKKKGGDLDDAELKRLKVLEDRKRRISKVQAKANSDKEKAELSFIGIASKVSQLQDDIGKRITRNGREIFQFSNSFKLAASSMQPMVRGGMQMTDTYQGLAEIMDKMQKSADLAENYLGGGSKAMAGTTSEMTAAIDEWTKNIGGEASLATPEMDDEGNVIRTTYDISGNKEVMEHAQSMLDIYIPLKERFEEAVSTMGQGLTNINGLQSDNIGLAAEMATSYSKLGTSGYQPSVDKAEELYEQSLKQAKITRSVILPDMKKKLKFMTMELSKLNKASPEYSSMSEAMKEMQDDMKEMDESAQVMVDTGAQNLANADRMRQMNNQIGASMDYILAPHEKLKSIMESLPFGKMISSFVDLEGLGKGFGDNIQKNLVGAFSEPTVALEEYTTKTGKIAERYRDLSTGQLVSKDDDSVLTLNDMDSSLDNITAGAMDYTKKLGDGLKKLGTQVGGINKAMGGMLGPLVAVVAIIAIAGKLAKMFYGGISETRKEFGLTFASAATLQATLNATTMEFQMMGVSAEDVKAGAQGIMDNLGGIGQVTRANLQTFASLNATLGLSGESAGVLASQMMAVGAGSIEAVGSQLESVGALAQANGVAPAQVLEDVAGASEAFANFAKDGGENVFKAAISARKLGVSMETVAGTADALLDFESSINAQMEASMLTGRNINTDKARELALAGDLDGMQREITKQIGSSADYEKLNVVQRKAMAAAFGVSVSELGKMVTNQDKLNNMTEEQVKRTDLIASLVQGLNSAWVAVMEALKPIIPLAIGILSPILLIAGAFAGVIVIVGKLLAMFNKLSAGGVGLGDVIMFITGAFIGYKLAMMAYNKVAMVQKAVDTILTGVKNLKIIGTLREIATDKIALVGKKLGITMARNQYAWSWKTIGVNLKKIAIAVKELVMEKAKKAAGWAWIGIQKLLMLGTIKRIALEKAKQAGELISQGMDKAKKAAALVWTGIQKLLMLGTIKRIALEKTKRAGELISQGMDKTKKAAALVWMGIQKLTNVGTMKSIILDKVKRAGELISIGIDKAKKAAMMVWIGLQNLSIGGTIRATAAMVFKNAVLIAGTVATWAATAANWALNAALNANPIGLIILGVIALVAVIVLLFKKFNLFPKIIGGVMKVFNIFKTAVMTALKIAFAPMFLAYKIFQKAKGFISSFFGGGDKSTEAASSGTSGGAPEMHSGGVVKETGNAVVEKGEVVSTPQQQQQQQQQQSSTISTQAMESKLDQLIELLGQSGPISIGVGGVKSNTKAISEQIV